LTTRTLSTGLPLRVGAGVAWARPVRVMQSRASSQRMAMFRGISVLALMDQVVIARESAYAEGDVQSLPAGWRLAASGASCCARRAVGLGAGEVGPARVSRRR